MAGNSMDVSEYNNKYKAPEKDVLSTIMEYLALINIFHWRNNTGMATYTDKNDIERKVRYGFPGSSDILGMFPSGKTLAIEAKKKGQKQSPKQIEFMDNVLANNGIYILAYSLDDVVGIVNREMGII